MTARSQYQPSSAEGPASLAERNAEAWALRFSDPLASAARAEEVYEEALARADARAAVEALLTLSHKAFYFSAYDQALTYAEEAFERAQGQSAELQARACLRLGAAQIDAERIGEATATLSEAQARFTALGDATGLAETAQCFAYIAIDRGDFVAALATLRRCAERSPEDDAGLARLEHLLCITHSYLGDRAGTAHHLARALGHAGRCGDRRRQAMLQGLKASLHEADGELAQALEDYLGVLGGLRALERIGLERSSLVAEYLGHVTDIYIRLGEWEQARRYGEEALGVAQGHGHGRFETEGLTRLGHIRRLLGDAEAARALLQRAWTLALTRGDRHAQTRLRYQFGLLSLGDAPERALEHFGSGLNLAEGSGLSLNETELCLGRAHALTALGRSAEALAAYREALVLAQRYGYKQQEADAHEALLRCAKATGDFESALGHFELFYRLSRELDEHRMSERTRTLTLRFDLERAEKTAELERRKNAELEQVNAALKVQSRENDALLAELRAQTLRLERQNREDALTGVANRRHLEELLERAFDEAERYAQPLCVAMMDIDNFKDINDTLSHSVGDAVLQTVSRIFGRFVRTADLVARYGGEEFVIVFPQTTGAGGYAVCERIREAVARYAWCELHPELSVTLSIGLTDERSVPDFEKLLTLADAKMYEAKRAGKNRVVR